MESFFDWSSRNLGKFLFTVQRSLCLWQTTFKFNFQFHWISFGFGHTTVRKNFLDFVVVVRASFPEKNVIYESTCQNMDDIIFNLTLNQRTIFEGKWHFRAQTPSFNEGWAWHELFEEVIWLRSSRTTFHFKKKKKANQDKLQHCFLKYFFFFLNENSI